MSKRTTPSSAEAVAIISSIDSCISDVSAEIVTAAQPLVGML